MPRLTRWLTASVARLTAVTFRSESPRFTGRMARPLLTVEMIPLPMWRRNVRAVVSSETWDELHYRFGATDTVPRNWRHPINRSGVKGARCAYCGATGVLQLHENWRYDDKRRIQRLTALLPLCGECHLAKHLGFARTQGLEEEALAHLARVNGWTRRQTSEHAAKASHVWVLRSAAEYKLDLSYLSRFVPTTRIHLNWLDEPRTWLRGHLDAVLWARDLLQSDNAVIVDTETTGLPKENPLSEVIELAVINMQGATIYRSLFRPLHPSPRRVIAIHGIRKKDVKTAPSFADQIPCIHDALHGKIVVSYNAKFDSTVVGNTCFMHNVEMPSCRWECAMMAYKVFRGFPNFVRLPYGKHRALADAKATLRLVRSMVKGYSFTTIRVRPV